MTNDFKALNVVLIAIILYHYSSDNTCIQEMYPGNYNGAYGKSTPAYNPGNYNVAYGKSTTIYKAQLQSMELYQSCIKDSRLHLRACFRYGTTYLTINPVISTKLFNKHLENLFFCHDLL